MGLSIVDIMLIGVLLINIGFAIYVLCVVAERDNIIDSYINDMSQDLTIIKQQQDCITGSNNIYEKALEEYKAKGEKMPKVAVDMYNCLKNNKKILTDKK